MNKWLLIGGLLLVILVLAFPVSNLIFKPKAVTVLTEKAGNDPASLRVAEIFEQKCHYCHVASAPLPFYASLPIAKPLMEYDVRTGVAWLNMGEEIFPEPGKVASQPVLAKIEYVMEKGQMPPRRYLIMHWDHFPREPENAAIRDWVKTVRAKAYADAGLPEGDNIQAIVPVPKALQLDERKVALGKRLFHDTRLSTDNSLSCASCHALDKGGTDQSKFATGVRKQLGPINSPTVYNSGFQFAQFWDGRAATLQEQAGGPVANPIEMGSNWPEVLGKLHQDPEFVEAFQAVYPGELRDENIRGAIAEFERSLLTPGSAFDRYLQGDGNALTPEEKQGYALFLENRCGTCHVGVILGGLSYEKMGRKADYFQARGHVQEADQGRFNHTKDPGDLHKFKTPTLRNIQVTFPYFHDGSTTDLAEAVRVMQDVQVGGQIPEEDVGRIVAFLNTLTGEYQGQKLR